MPEYGDCQSEGDGGGPTLKQRRGDFNAKIGGAACAVSSRAAQPAGATPGPCTSDSRSQMMMAWLPHRGLQGG